MICKRCQTQMRRNGHRGAEYQKWRCPSCGYNYEERLSAAPPTTPNPVVEPTKSPVAAPVKTEGKPMGLTEEQLRAKHDLRYIVATKCKQLKKGTYLSQGEFVQFCGINAGARYRDILEQPTHDTYHGKAPGGTVYWGHPDSIKALKDEGVLT